MFYRGFTIDTDRHGTFVSLNGRHVIAARDFADAVKLIDHFLDT